MASRPDLLRILVRAFAPPEVASDRTQAAALAADLDARLAAAATREPIEEDAATFDRVFDAVEAAASDRGDADALAQLRTVRRRLATAGAPGSSLARFARKGALLTTLAALAEVPSVAASVMSPPPPAAVSAAFSPRVTVTARVAAGVLASEVPALAAMPHAPEPVLLSPLAATAAAAAISSPTPARRTAAEPPAHPGAAAARGIDCSDVGMLHTAAEDALLDDCMLTLVGRDGRFVRYDEARGAFALHATPADARLGAVGAVPSDVPGNVSEVPISPQGAATIARASEVGIYFVRVAAAVVDRSTADVSAGAAAASVAGGDALRMPAVTAMPARGTVAQALVASVCRELVSYQGLLASLHADVKTARLAPAAVGSPPRWTLRRLFIWCEEPLHRLSTLAKILAQASDCEGGTLLTLLWRWSQDGDAAAAALATRLLAAAATPWIDRINHFLATGEVSLPGEPAAALTDIAAATAARDGAAAAADGDAFVAGERAAMVEAAARAAWERSLDFFVVSVPSDTGSSSGSEGDAGSASIGDGSAAWGRRYRLVPRQVPPFFAPKLAQALLEAGRTVAFLRSACGDGAWVVEHVAPELAAVQEGARAAGLDVAGALQLARPAADAARRAGGGDVVVALLTEQRALTAALGVRDCCGARYADVAAATIGPPVAARALHLLLHKHNLLSHLGSMHRFLLLTQGDFVSVLVAAIAPELAKPAASAAIARHTLEGFLETAIRASNASRADADVLRRLSVRILPPSPGEVGWDVFTLQYDLTPPASTLLPPVALEPYARLFHFLFRVKRLAHALNETWSAHMAANHRLRSQRHAGLNGCLHMCHLLRSDMGTWVSNVDNHLMLDVLAHEWATFEADVGRVADVPALLRRHAAMMEALLDRCLLSPRTAAVQAHVAALLAEGLRFCALQAGLVAAAVEAADERRAAEAAMAARSAAGSWGVPIGVEDLDALDERVAAALDGLVRSYGPRIADVARRYRSHMAGLLAAVDSVGEGLEELRGLALRFDFTDFYRGSGSASSAGR